MGTRSAIGIVKSRDENGHPLDIDTIYCHWDGYPDGVGRTLVDQYRLHFRGILSVMLETILNEAVGWSVICNADLRLPPIWIDPLNQSTIVVTKNGFHRLHNFLEKFNGDKFEFELDRALFKKSDTINIQLVDAKKDKNDYIYDSSHPDFKLLSYMIENAPRSYTQRGEKIVYNKEKTNINNHFFTVAEAIASWCEYLYLFDTKTNILEIYELVSSKAKLIRTVELDDDEEIQWYDDDDDEE